MKRNAFTLVELLVVVAIIGLLSTVAVVSTNASRMNARNTKRKADMVQISKALELYYADNGAYPSTTSNWWGVCGCGGGFTVKDDSGAGGWIPNLAPAYMSTLPRDPNTGKGNPNSTTQGCKDNAVCNCYIYKSNGVDYKIGAHCTPEGAVATTDPFRDPNYSYIFQVSSPGGYNFP